MAHALPKVPAEQRPDLPWLVGPNPKVAVAEPKTDHEPSAEEVEFFEREIRPLLVENCLSCHGPEDHQQRAL